MPTMFNSRDADNYEKLMGRWSRRLAPLFIEHAGIARGEEVLEVGCGTRSLTFALAAAAALGGLTAIDYSPIYLAAAQTKAGERSIRFEQGDGCALRFSGRQLRPCIVHAGAPVGSAAPRIDDRRDAPGYAAGRCRRRGILGFAWRDAAPADAVGHCRRARRRRSGGTRPYNVAAGLRAGRAGADVGGSRVHRRRSAVTVDPNGFQRLFRLLGTVRER